jgi:hypothetical protein
LTVARQIKNQDEDPSIFQACYLCANFFFWVPALQRKPTSQKMKGKKIEEKKKEITHQDRAERSKSIDEAGNSARVWKEDQKKKGKKK